jgi:hypothetical protein
MRLAIAKRVVRFDSALQWERYLQLNIKDEWSCVTL